MHDWSPTRAGAPSLLAQFPARAALRPRSPGSDPRGEATLNSRRRRGPAKRISDEVLLSSVRVPQCRESDLERRRRGYPDRPSTQAICLIDFPRRPVLSRPLLGPTSVPGELSSKGRSYPCVVLLSLGDSRALKGPLSLGAGERRRARDFSAGERGGIAARRFRRRSTRDLP